VALSIPLEVYVGAFAAATLGCLVGLRRARRIETPDTRRGFVALLATSGLWAAAQAGFLLAPGVDLKVAFHVVGLVVGFSTVGAWLYFCSAYSGRSMHRNPRYRRAAVAIFLAVTLVKVTNPLHHAYFTWSVASEPFRHVVVDNGVLHWVTTGLAYSLSAVGYFMLFELFDRTSLDARPLAVLVTVTGLPIIFNVVGYASPSLVDMTYEPIGVAVFALGVLYVFAERFERVRLTGDVAEPVVFVDDEGNVREFNEKALELFPALAKERGTPLDDVIPEVAAILDTDEAILELDTDEGRRYYLLTANPFTVGHTEIGQMVLFSDVTRSERHRRELERQNERLGEFASIVSHDLRNPLNVAKGHLDLAREERDSEHLETVANAHERMENIIEDVLELARHGETIGETDSCDLRLVAEDGWATVDTTDATLEFGDDVRIQADRDRLVQLFENLFRNAVEHGSTSPDSNTRQDAVEHASTSPDSNTRQDAVEHASTSPGSQTRQDAVEPCGESVTITVGALVDQTGFFVADDGPGIPAEDRDAVFEPGHTTIAEGTGFGLAIVKNIAEAHGWTISVTESETGGARFEIEGVTPAE
jgi:signal transduction histidine kinase